MRKWNTLGAQKWNNLAVTLVFLGPFFTIGILKILDILIGVEWLNIVAAIVLITILVILITFSFYKYDKEIKIEEEKSQKERFQTLRERYADYVSLVNEIRNEKLKEVDDKKLEECGLSISEDYLESYEKNINWICKNRIYGKPDTFILAACLMYSLIKKPILPTCDIDDFVIKELNELKITMNQFIYSTNYEIAFEVALRLISEPSTYYKDEKGRWIEEKHPKVNIVVPDGLIKNSPLYHRILNTIAKDFQTGMDYYVMQLSNLLHLIYLNCN